MTLLPGDIVFVHKDTPDEYEAIYLTDYHDGKSVVLKDDCRIRVSTYDITFKSRPVKEQPKKENKILKWLSKNWPTLATTLAGIIGAKGLNKKAPN